MQQSGSMCCAITDKFFTYSMSAWCIGNIQGGRIRKTVVHNGVRGVAFML